MLPLCTCLDPCCNSKSRTAKSVGVPYSRELAEGNILNVTVFTRGWRNGKFWHDVGFFFFSTTAWPPPSPILPNVVYFDHVCYVSVTSKSHYITHLEENRAVASLGPDASVFSGTPKSWGISNSMLMPNYCRTKDTANFVYWLPDSSESWVTMKDIW